MSRSTFLGGGVEEPVRVATIVYVFGALFFLVASGTVVVCKNNTRVLGRSGPEQGKHWNSLTSRDIIKDMIR